MLTSYDDPIHIDPIQIEPCPCATCHDADHCRVTGHECATYHRYVEKGTHIIKPPAFSGDVNEAILDALSGAKIASIGKIVDLTGAEKKLVTKAATHLYKKGLIGRTAIRGNSRRGYLYHLVGVDPSAIPQQQPSTDMIAQAISDAAMSAREIAEATGLKPDTARKAVIRMVKEGTAFSRADPDNRTTPIYSMSLDALRALRPSGPTPPSPDDGSVRAQIYRAVEREALSGADVAAVVGGCTVPSAKEHLRRLYQSGLLTRAEKWRGGVVTMVYRADQSLPKKKFSEIEKKG